MLLELIHVFSVFIQEVRGQEAAPLWPQHAAPLLAHRLVPTALVQVDGGLDLATLLPRALQLPGLDPISIWDNVAAV